MAIQEMFRFNKEPGVMQVLRPNGDVAFDNRWITMRRYMTAAVSMVGRTSGVGFNSSFDVVYGKTFAKIPYAIGISHRASYDTMFLQNYDGSTYDDLGQEIPGRYANPEYTTAHATTPRMRWGSGTSLTNYRGWAFIAFRDKATIYNLDPSGSGYVGNRVVTLQIFENQVDGSA